MKILFCIESLHSGGKERRLVELISGLSKYPEIKMELVLTKKDIFYTKIYQTGIKLHFLNKTGIKKDPRIFYHFFKIARKFKPDLIHVWGNMAALLAIPTKVLLRIPMINNQITEVPLKLPAGFFTYKFTFKFSDLILSNTLAGLKCFSAPRSKSKCIYNGFDFQRVQSLNSKREIKEKFQIKTKYLIGMVATFSIYKDYKAYIEAAISVCKKREDVTFISIGGGDYSAYKKKVPRDFIDRILFVGKQNNVESIMNVCDIGVLASFTEGISNSILEFMALSKPVIATGGGGTREIVVDGENGFHIEARNPILLAEKIEKLLDEPALIVEFGEKGKKIVQTKFEIDQMIRSFINEYKIICVE